MNVAGSAKSIEKLDLCSSKNYPGCTDLTVGGLKRLIEDIVQGQITE